MYSAYVNLAKAATDIAFGSPYVMGVRINALMTPGASLTRRGQAENIRMVAEKQAAFYESAWAAATQFQLGMMNVWFGLATGRLPRMSGTTLARAAHRTIRPYQKRVTANSRRLKRGRMTG